MLNDTLDRRPASLRARIVIVAFLIAIALPAASIRAQAFYTLSGHLSDPSGRALANATLALTNQTSGAIYQIQSDAQGQYEFVGLPSSKYALQVKLAGFETMTLNDITIGSDTQRDLQLSVGSLQETITVSASAAPAPPRTVDQSAVAAQFAQRIQKTQAACNADASAAGGRIVAPYKLFDVAPIYPDAERTSGAGGIVTMDAVIGVDGFVTDVRQISGGDAALQRAAEDAVRQWQFSQTLLNCQPIAVHMKVTVRFIGRDGR